MKCPARYMNRACICVKRLPAASPKHYVVPFSGKSWNFMGLQQSVDFVESCAGVPNLRKGGVRRYAAAWEAYAPRRTHNEDSPVLPLAWRKFGSELNDNGKNLHFG